MHDVRNDIQKLIMNQKLIIKQNHMQKLVLFDCMWFSLVKKYKHSNCILLLDVRNSILFWKSKGFYFWFLWLKQKIFHFFKQKINLSYICLLPRRSPAKKQRTFYCSKGHWPLASRSKKAAKWGRLKWTLKEFNQPLHGRSYKMFGR